MSRTVIPSGDNVKQPGKNQTYVNSRQGSSVENKMTSAKMQNPEFFKKQSDRKHHDQGPFQMKQFSHGTSY